MLLELNHQNGMNPALELSHGLYENDFFERLFYFISLYKSLEVSATTILTRFHLNGGSEINIWRPLLSVTFYVF